MIALPVIQIGWERPPNVGAAVTTRSSPAPFGQANLADHVEEPDRAWVSNRARLRAQLGFRLEPYWLRQVHGDQVISVNRTTPPGAVADAAYTRESGQPLVVLVADCVPVLVCASDGSCVGVAHAGWRGLACGVIAALVDQMGSNQSLQAWIGPSIGPCHFEVGDDVRRQFPASANSFKPSEVGGHWLMDLWAETERQLRACGIQRVERAGQCTWCRDDLYFSYRREGKTGRFAALVWRD